jgi:hypothetical protein
MGFPCIFIDSHGFERSGRLDVRHLVPACASLKIPCASLWGSSILDPGSCQILDPGSRLLAGSWIHYSGSGIVPGNSDLPDRCLFQCHFVQIPRYQDTSEFLKSRIAIIGWIPGYTYPDISPDIIHQPAGVVWQSRQVCRTTLRLICLGRCDSWAHPIPTRWWCC